MSERSIPRIAGERPATRPASALHGAVLIAGVTAACALRVVIGGSAVASSQPAAIVFAGALVALAVASGFRWAPDRNWPRAGLLGLAGAAVLVAAWATAAPHVLLSAGQHLGPLLVWTPLVILVAAAEELVLRGALFGDLFDLGGAPLAVVATAIVFGLMHVPLYGWAALPLDVAAGVLFGGLRLLSGGVTAPLLAHVLADLAGGWLG